jgi:hypothetical protein
LISAEVARNRALISSPAVAWSARVGPPKRNIPRKVRFGNSFLEWETFLQVHMRSPKGIHILIELVQAISARPDPQMHAWQRWHKEPRAPKLGSAESAAASRPVQAEALIVKENANAWKVS